MGSLGAWGHLVSERLKMEYIHRNGKLVFWTAAIVVLGCVGPAQQSARAQNSVAGWPDKNFAQEQPKPVRFDTRATVLRNGKFDSDEEEQKFTEYYTKSLFPNVTWYKPPNRQAQSDVIAKLRTDLKACEGRPEQQVFNKLADLTLAYMTKIANDGQYHPAARVNAMLAIGEVNSPRAAQVLLDAAFGRGKVFALRVAAMAGLVRMAGPSGRGVLLSDPDFERSVVTKMVTCVGLKNRDDGIFWMRGQAADVLGDLGDPQEGVPAALLAMLNDKYLPIPLRSKAARALGKLKYGDNLPAAGPYLKALAAFADDALGSDQPVDRARVRLVVHDAEDGLKQFAKSPNDQDFSNELKKILQEIDKETEDKMTSEDLKTSINKAKESLDSLLKK